MSRSDHAQHGREATSPLTIPPRGWWDVAMRIKDAIGRDHLALTAAGVAFYGLLAIFPAIAAAVSLWGLLASPSGIEAEIAGATSMLPAEAGGIITDQVKAIAATAGTGISFATGFGLLFALWSASKGIKAMMEGLNIIYDERERRGFLRLGVTAILLTFGAILVALLALGAILVVPIAIAALGLDGAIGDNVTMMRWPILALVVLFALAILYRIAPSRRQARWQWVSLGAVVATALWIAASVGFSLYVAHFGNYNETYGALGGVIILLMWLWLSAFVVLLGAELNAELEHQTERDSTIGDTREMGQRGARMADTVGESA